MFYEGRWNSGIESGAFGTWLYRMHSHICRTLSAMIDAPGCFGGIEGGG